MPFRQTGKQILAQPDRLWGDIWMLLLSIVGDEVFIGQLVYRYNKFSIKGHYKPYFKTLTPRLKVKTQTPVK